ncbi:hypothetical protein [Tritonibacter sp. SIMBA_163]|uniref:hypothetical protein n=1 Tax=Tritonibacter sp. SIMBA_163 TaxID=3080868 RepID=UPI003980B74C
MRHLFCAPIHWALLQICEEAIRRIALLYKVEKATRGKSPADRGLYVNAMPNRALKAEVKQRPEAATFNKFDPQA